MDLRQIEYFVRVAELGSFTRAAAALDVAQPALSRQVRLLEVELRQNLLVRNGRGAVPTEAGKLLLDHGRGILHQVERAREELGRVRGSLAGRVAIGLPPSVAKAMAVPLIREFRARMPDATLSITEGLSVAMQESLADGRLDIALLYNAVPSADIELTPLLEESLFLVQRHAGKSAPPARPRPVALRDVAEMPLVIPSRPNAIRMLVETEMGGAGLPPQRGPGDRRGGGHPGPGGRRGRQRHPVAQRGADIGAAPGLLDAADRHAQPAQQAVHGHELAASRHADAEGRAGADQANRENRTRPALSRGYFFLDSAIRRSA